MTKDVTLNTNKCMVPLAIIATAPTKLLSPHPFNDRQGDTIRIVCAAVKTIAATVAVNNHSTLSTQSADILIPLENIYNAYTLQREMS